MGRYYRKRRKYINNKDLKLIAKIILLPIALMIGLIKLCCKKSLNINKQENKKLQLNEKGKKINKIKITFVCISIFLFGMFIYFAYWNNILNGYSAPITLILLIISIITTIIFKKLAEKETLNVDTYEIYTENSKYHIKEKTITNNEKYFLDIIKKHFNDEYEIRVQVPLSSIIEKEKEFEGQYQNELNRIIDIGIFDKSTSYPLLLIEVNDNTHHRKDRQIRDAKVKYICNQANLKIIEFWTENLNTENYIIDKINENLSI